MPKFSKEEQERIARVIEQQITMESLRFCMKASTNSKFLNKSALSVSQVEGFKTCMENYSKLYSAAMESFHL